MSTMLYEEDFYAWTRVQAEALRKLSARRGLPNDLDPLRVAEEIEDTGSEKLSAATSLLTQILVHLLKLAARPDDDPPAAHWQEEVVTLHLQLTARYQRSMRQYIDPDRVWRRAVKTAAQLLALHGQDLGPTADECPLDLHGIADAEVIDVMDLVRRLRSSTLA